MKLQTVLSKVNNILKYPQRRRKEKLYKQWVKRAGLPPEAIPHEEVAEEIMPEPDKKELHVPPEVIHHEEVAEEIIPEPDREELRTPPEAIPHEEVTEEITPEPAGKRKLRSDTVYILFAVSIVLFCISLVILISQSC